MAITQHKRKIAFKTISNTARQINHEWSAGSFMNRRVAPALLTSWLLLVTLTLAAQRSGQSAIIRHTKDGYSTQLGTPLTGMHELQLAQRFITSERAFNAFFMSEFDFWDARILADYWNLSLTNSKLNIGRKLISNQQNGTLDFAINTLNSQIRRARDQYFRSVRYGNPSTYALYLEYYSYNDAKLLAQLWNNGNASPQQIVQAKYAIDRGLALGNYDFIEASLKRARQMY